MGWALSRVEGLEGFRGSKHTSGFWIEGGYGFAWTRTLDLELSLKLPQEKSSPSISASAMLHGAAFRPLYVSFLPGLESSSLASSRIEPLQQMPKASTSGLKRRDEALKLRCAS